MIQFFQMHGAGKFKYFLKHSKKIRKPRAWFFSLKKYFNRLMTKELAVLYCILHLTMQKFHKLFWNHVKHLWWSAFAKIEASSSWLFSQICSITDVWQVNTPLRFGKDSSLNTSPGKASRKSVQSPEKVMWINVKSRKC